MTPEAEAMTNPFAPEACHEPALDSAPRRLRYRAGADYARWRTAVRRKLGELLGPDPERVPLNVRREWDRDEAEFRERRIVFTSERHADVPCHLLVPKRGRPPYPVVICLQGHSTGMHISLGRPKYPGDERTIAGGDRDFALQAVRQGYAALALEQRCFGERADSRSKDVRSIQHTCHHASMTALLLGRTMIGERVWDVRRAIEVLREFPEVDARRIACMGNSGGGTITYFAACMEPRIQAAMPSCYVCSLGRSIGRIDHCADNYVPGMLQWFDLGDLACLIAPRPLVVVAGATDNIFPIEGVRECYAVIEEVYRAAGAAGACRLVVGEEGHRFYAAAAWPVFRELTGWS